MGILRSRYRGFLSFDAMLGILPVLMMLLLLMQVCSGLMDDAADRLHGQQVFDKLVSAADYSVKSGLAREADGIRYPNWLEGSVSASYTESLRERMGLSSLEISFGDPSDGHGLCIYRIVAVGDGKKPDRLFFCGD